MNRKASEKTTTRTPDLSAFLTGIAKEMENQKAEHVKRICRRIEPRLRRLKQHLPGFAFCDGMGVTSMWVPRPGTVNAALTTQPLVLAFEHIRDSWSDSGKPLLVHAEDDIPERAIAAAIVKAHGKTIHEVLVLVEFLNEQLNTYFGSFR